MNDGNKGTAALLSVESDGGSLPDALFSARVVVWDEGSLPGALFSAHVVECVGPTVSSGLLSSLGLVVCCGNSVGDL